MIKKISYFFLICMCFVTNTFAFGACTHKFLTREAVTNLMFALRLEKKGLSTLESNDLKNKLLEGCNIPDDDFFRGFGTAYYYHFFDIYDVTQHAHSALSEMRNCFNDAIDSWKTDSRHDAMTKLSMAIHYAQDMCCIAHQTSWSNNNVYVHVQYENIVENYVKYNENELRNNLKYIWSNISNQDIGIDVNDRAWSLRENRCILSLDKSDAILIIGKEFFLPTNYTGCIKDVKFAYLATCDLINSFCRECGIGVQCQ